MLQPGVCMELSVMDCRLSFFFFMPAFVCCKASYAFMEGYNYSISEEKELKFWEWKAGCFLVCFFALCGPFCFAAN